MTPIKTAAALMTIAVAASAPAGSEARASARGTSCTNPWRVSYSSHRLKGDTSKVFLTVATHGSRITVTWRAQRGFRFCAIVLTEARGQVFRSTNPAASYTYTDYTSNHTNGVKTITATARNGR